MAFYPRLTAAEAAAMIRHQDMVACGGFTSAGSPKSIPVALAERIGKTHSAGREFQIGLITVATGRYVDGALGPARGIRFRTPFQTDPQLRGQINHGEVDFVDPHLSHLSQAIRYGSLGPLDFAIVEACEVTGAGEIVLTSAVGGAPTFCERAKKILIELNHRQPPALRGFHDIYEPSDPPCRREIPLYRPSDRIGSEVVRVDPARIAGIVETSVDDETVRFDPPAEVTEKIGHNVAEFLAGEMAAGRMPAGFLPVQSGVGDIANGVLGALGRHPDIPVFEMYTEIIQDAVIRLMQQDRIRFASCCALTVSQEALRFFHENLDWFRPRLVLRPQEITNHPEVVRRLGLVSINTALEADLFGNVNSTHLLGRQMLNGIGGSGDFTRNAYLSIFTCPSTARGGAVSTLVPMVTHVDHNEHSVQVIATEWGVADLRWKSPRKRARLIIEKCAHPDYREALEDYLKLVENGHTPHTLAAAFRMHELFMECGDMRGIRW